MKLNLITTLLSFGFTLGDELTSAKYTITNAQYTGGQLSASSISSAISQPKAYQILNESSLKTASADSSTDDSANEQLKTWQLNKLGNGYWTLQNSVTKQYLMPQGFTGLKFSLSFPFPWQILPLPGDLYVITTANNQYALALKSPTTAEIDLTPATGAVTQNWVFTKVE